MLVLSRRTGESVVIGDDVVVTVLELKGDGAVRLGIDAPRSTRVYRAEVYAAVKAANAEASRAGQPASSAVEALMGLAGARRPASASSESAPQPATSDDPPIPPPSTRPAAPARPGPRPGPPPRR
ncbi:carbon storage regulator CsrA [Aquipuribacter nitratireducens]|uniref:Translational regulator CsrA n=1 Tax=Aquipuribacter nitratireducens TaxID=650104 RepID=A0ABW0GPR1_9MICO